MKKREDRNERGQNSSTRPSLRRKTKDEDDSDDEQEHKGECSSSNPPTPHGPFYLKDPSRKRTGEG